MLGNKTRLGRGPQSGVDAGGDRPATEAQILIAEDNLINQKLALRMLKKLGYEADLANNGQEVLEKLEMQQYDIIFMDVQMPHMDGLEATRRIRKYDKDPIIIAMTANVMDEDRENCFRAGMNDFLPKPIHIGEIQRCLQHWLTVRRAGRQAQSYRKTESLVEHAMVRELRSMGDSEFLRELLDLFLEQSADLLLQLRRAAVQCDVKLLKEAAHALKGISLNVGASYISSMCGEIEASAKADHVKWADIRHSVSELAAQRDESVLQIKNEFFNSCSLEVL